MNRSHTLLQYYYLSLSIRRARASFITRGILIHIFFCSNVKFVAFEFSLLPHWSGGSNSSNKNKEHMHIFFMVKSCFNLASHQKPEKKRNTPPNARCLKEKKLRRHLVSFFLKILMDSFFLFLTEN